MIKLLILSLLATVLQVSSLNLFFENPKLSQASLQEETCSENATLANNETVCVKYDMNYEQAILPHNQNTDLKFPVRKLTDLNQRRLQLCIETDEKGASISFQDNTGHDVKIIGRGCGCWKPSKDELLIEFYCIDSCLTSDTVFNYRFIWSIKKPPREDTWCDRVIQTFPSDYIVVATDPPAPVTTPRLEEDSSAKLIEYNIAVVVTCTFLALYSIFGIIF